jgi:rod shape determining protein RodA
VCTPARQPALPRPKLSATSPFRHLDVALLAGAVALAGMGVLMVYSATRAKMVTAGLDPHYFLTRQALWVSIGLVAMVATALIDYRIWREVSPLAYGVVVLALLAVMSPIGTSAQGSQRWFGFGSLQLQPSAFASLALVLVLASFGAGRREGEFSLRALGAIVGAGAVLIGLVAIQPDLGSALVLGAVMLTVLVVIGVPGRYLAGFVAAAIVLGAVALHAGLLKDYQLHRLTAFLDQSHHRAPQATYNVDESKIAIASGGLTGRGLFHGSQTNLSYVPEQQTDFIFTAVGEQLGLVGSATVLALFGVLLWRVLRVAQLARDTFGTLLCTGVLAIFMVQVFENVGMTTGIMPIAGIPLPLMSYGGSGTIVALAGLGIVQSVHMRRFLPASPGGGWSWG